MTAEVIDLAAARTRRTEARNTIVQAANRLAVSKGRHYGWPLPVRLYTTKQIQQAVAVCRHWGLVDDATLAAAGFGGRRLNNTAAPVLTIAEAA
ncbi:MAG TPA: hypothetical protein VFP61_11750 [Acidimicrobiales bacterium]|nr:hypothetical protein [Acidimicrobiales bacterium]